MISSVRVFDLSPRFFYRPTDKASPNDPERYVVVNIEVGVAGSQSL